MEITALVHDITVSMVPLLPYLFKAGEAAAEEAGKKLAGAAWDELKKLWRILRPSIEVKPAALEAAHEAAVAPDDDDAQAALRFQLKKLLTEDPALAAAVDQWWKQAKRSGIEMTIQGNRNIAVGGQVDRSTLVTGDQNVVKS
jgi:hypothetical protein